jgi:hypothetical protein
MLINLLFMRSLYLINGVSFDLLLDELMVIFCRTLLYLFLSLQSDDVLDSCFHLFSKKIFYQMQDFNS